MTTRSCYNGGLFYLSLSLIEIKLYTFTDISMVYTLAVYATSIQILLIFLSSFVPNDIQRNDGKIINHRTGYSGHLQIWLTQGTLTEGEGLVQLTSLC
jgi:hypothetical protein